MVKSSLKSLDSSSAQAVKEFVYTEKTKIDFWLSKFEKFDSDRVISACINAGVSPELAQSISEEVSRYVDTSTKMSDVRPLIFALLQRHDQRAARNFRGKEIFVQTSKETFEKFDKSKITISLVKETELEKDLAEQIANETEKFIRDQNPDYVSSSLIREIVNFNLVKYGLEDKRKLYARLGMPVYDITQLINIGDKENANLQYNPESIHKLIADYVSREYALNKLIPRKAALSHLTGQIHIHDLDYFALRPFCFSHDLRFFLKHGFCADGQGIHTAAACPAKHADVAILHAEKILGSAQTNCAGGQGFNWFNTYLAPYLRGLYYKTLKQLAQMFLFEMSQMYVARGGQTVFSSIDIDPSVPKILRDIPSVLPGGKQGPPYEEFENEANMFFNALIDVFTDGDAYGKLFNWPKCEITIEKDFFKKFPEEARKVSALAAKFGTPYYFIKQPYMPDYSCYQCCAYQMPLSELTDQNDLINGTVRGGAMQVITINLPRIAYDANGNDAKLFELLRERILISKEVMLKKREIMHKRLKQGILPFLSQKLENGQYYYEPDKQALEIGFIGLNEMLQAHLGQELHESQQAWIFGLRVIKEMADIISELNINNDHFALSRTPAEGCTHRLALIDLKEFNGKAIVQGDRSTGSVYYTNGMHIRPSVDMPLINRLKIESSFHPLLTGGAMSHVFLGESYPSVDALTRLTEKIATQTLMGYFAFTKDLTICINCKFVVPGIQNICSKCGSDKIDWYSRVTGYLQRVSSWNKGKQQEFQDRHRYSGNALII